VRASVTEQHQDVSTHGDWYLPAAVATVVSSGPPHPCSGCGEWRAQFYGLMGANHPMLCGRCYDDWAFNGRPALRAAMEAKRDLMFSGVRHLLDRVIWAEAA
jgi:hypothetical protein